MANASAGDIFLFLAVWHLLKFCSVKTNAVDVRRVSKPIHLLSPKDKQMKNGVFYDWSMCAANWKKVFAFLFNLAYMLSKWRTTLVRVTTISMSSLSERDAKQLPQLLGGDQLEVLSEAHWYFAWQQHRTGSGGKIKEIFSEPRAGKRRLDDEDVNVLSASAPFRRFERKALQAFILDIGSISLVRYSTC